MIFKKQNQISSKLCKIFRLTGSTKSSGSDFRGSEPNFTIGQSPKIRGNLSKICIKINKNLKMIFKKQNQISSNLCRIIRLRGSTKSLGSDFRGSERNFTIGQSPKIRGNFSKICIKINKNVNTYWENSRKNANY